MQTPDPNYFKEHPHSGTQYYIKPRWPEFYDYLQATYPGLKLSEQMYRYFYGGPGICPVCGKPTNYINFNKGYNICCSVKCSRNYSATKEKSKQTCLEKYGVEYVTQAQQMKDRSRQTCLEKYGVEHVLQNKDIMGKVRQTNKERHGVEYAGQISEGKEKSKRTCLEKYGVEYTAQSQQMKVHARQTCIEKYGVGHPMQADIIKKKAMQTCMQRYGVDNVAQYNPIRDKFVSTTIDKYGGVGLGSPELRQKISNTCLERYGAEWPQSVPEIHEKAMDALRQRNINGREHLIGYTEDGQWICTCPHEDTCSRCEERCYIISASQYNDRVKGESELCTILNPIGSKHQSSCEQWVESLLRKYGIEYERNNRSILPDGLELDFYIPSKQIAIECNGLYWHKTSRQDKITKHPLYHELKTDRCEERGIQLIHIWEDYYWTKREVVANILLSKLGIYKRKLHARTCKLKLYIKSNKHITNFLNQTHLQGVGSTSCIYYTLEYDGEIVSLMSFGKRSVLGDKTQWELIRYCVAPNTHVSGGAGRLLSHFIKDYQPTTITSFASRDISNGNLYKSLGFEYVRQTSSYWYVDKADYKRYHRANFTKKSLVKQGLGKPEQSEFDIMEIWNKYYRIHDSGQTKWILKCNKKEEPN